MYFSKKEVQSPQKMRSFREFLFVKVTLQSVSTKVTFNCTVSYRKNGEQDVLLAPPIILLGQQLLPLPPACSRVY